MMTTLRNALIITNREVRDSFRDWRILAPIIILTFLFPALAQFIAAQFTDFVTGYGAEIIADRSIPFLLMVVGFFPISISLVIALETFVGEKERRSLEPLLSTPLTNTELYIGKTLAAMIPPLVSSYGGMAVYLLSLLGGELEWRPPAMLIVQIILLTTAQALVMVTGAVVISSQTTSTRAANLLASFIIIPMALIIQAESVIMFLAPDATSDKGIGALWAILAGMFFIVLLLLRLGNSIFNREELLGRQIDQINIRGFFANLWKHIRTVDATGTPAKNLLEWYRYGIPLSLKRTRTALLITTVAFMLFFVVGFVVGLQPAWQLPLFSETTVDHEAITNLEQYIRPDFQGSAISFIIANNLRILSLTFILSIFTFGVMSLVLTPAVYVILGYIFSQVALTGEHLPMVLAAVIPHGIIEIPVIILAAGAALKLGAVITRPPDNLTVGQAWQRTLGDSIKLFIGLIIPGLILAALIEALITPQIVLAVLGG